MTTAQGSGSDRRPEPPFLDVARVLRPWGVRGDVKVEVLTSNPDDLIEAKQVYLGDDAQPVRLERARLHSGVLLIKLAGCDTPEAAEALRGQIVRIAHKDATPLRPNQYYHSQILGLEVVTADGEVLGKVVEIVETGANDVYAVSGPRGEVLIPARHEFITRIDLDAGRMIVSLLPGMSPE